MQSLTDLLEVIKTEMGYRTSKSFHTYLSTRGLKGNYQHFMKIFKGEVTVSHEFVTQLGEILPKWQDQLTLVYCKNLFPKQSHLFADTAGVQQERAKESGIPSSNPSASELTARQVESLGRNKDSYFIFMLATLSRRPLLRKELLKYFDAKALNQALEALERERLLSPVKDGYQTFGTEVKFPKADASLRKIYERMDQWDRDFAHEMDLETILQKRLLRRISSRYLLMILQHLDLILQTVRCADELETRYNSEVIQLVVEVRKGQLPG